MVWIRGLLLAGAAVLCIALPAQAAARTPSGYTIEPPAGWPEESLKGSRSAALGLVLAQWLSFDRGDEEYIEVDKRSSYGFNAQSFLEFYRAYLTRNGSRILGYRHVPLCHGEVGALVKSRAPKEFGGELTEDIIFVDGSHVYSASYHVPPSLRPLPAAIRAIASLCIRNPIVAKPLSLPVAFSAPPGWLESDPKETGGPVWPGSIAYYFDPAQPDNSLTLARNLDDTSSSTRKGDANAIERAMKRENVHEKMLSPVTHTLKQLCGDYIGMFFEYTVAFGAERLEYEQMTLLSSPMYSALYIRPAGTKPSKLAMNSLSTICPLGSPTPSPSANPSPASTAGGAAMDRR